MQRDASSPEAYRNAVEEPLRQILESVREAIFNSIPEVKEGIRYGMLDYPGLANLAAQKNYVALYVAPEILASWKDQFPGVSAGKSCLRFRKSDQLNRQALDGLLREVWRLRGE